MADVKWQSRSLYLGKSGYSTEVMQRCSLCGAAVFSEDKKTHIKWHEEIDEIVDWARSVSELFKRNPEQPHELNSGGLSEEDRGISEASIKDRFNMGGSEEGLQKGSE